MQVNIIPVIFAQYFLVISFIFAPVGSRHTFWYQKILQAGILSRLNIFPIISYFAMLTICLCISKMLCVTFTESTTNVSVIVKLPIQIVHVNMYITIFFIFLQKPVVPRTIIGNLNARVKYILANALLAYYILIILN